MQISHVSIENLRSIASLSLNFESVTALLGGNNSGKSTILRALQLFFEAAPKIEDDDYHQRKAQSIKISVRFINLTESEVTELGAGIVDDALTITRTFHRTKDADHGQYAVTALACEDFVGVRQVEGKADRLNRYREIREQYGLPNVRAADDAEIEMFNWEQNNREMLRPAAVRNFFVPLTLLMEKLGKRLQFIISRQLPTQQSRHPKTKRTP
jgi:putative ATP-dependent endonuclease of the OLD family